MKKAILAVALAATMGMAQAVEVGVNVGKSYAGEDRPVWGFSLGQKFGDWGVTGGFDRATRGANDLNRWTLVGSYDVAKFGPVTVQAKAGAAYLDPQVKPSGYAGLAGIGAEYALTKTVKLTADYQHQFGQNRVEQFNGNLINAGIKVSF